MWKEALAGLFPSTVGVSILAASALAFDARLAAVLAGFLAGMGLASLAHAARLLAWERREHVRVLVDRGGGGRVYVRDAD